jgi:pimeloyl-ACP methyl ester carboxylesterase
LEKSPLKLKVDVDGSKQNVFFTRRDMQQLAAGGISDPAGALQVLQLYQAVEHGITEPLVQVVHRYGDIGSPISFHAMSTAMDLASGQSDDHYHRIMTQAKTALLGSQLNSSIHLTGVISGLDLGDEFREAPTSDVPTLVLRGTLDGRIYPESQLEATSGLSRRHVVTIVNAGHNLFMTSPKVGEIMKEFMRGESIKQTEISVGLPW